MLRAAFVLASRGVLDFAHAWRLISAHPAAAARLADRGRIAERLRGDLVLVEPARQRVVAAIVDGRIAHLGPGGAERLRA